MNDDRDPDPRYESGGIFCIERMQFDVPVAVRIAALRAIVALDSIGCAPMSPCEGPVTAAIFALIPIARQTDAPEDFFAVNELAAALKEQGLEP